MVLNVFLVPNKLGYGGLASLFAARGTAGPPIYCDLSTQPFKYHVAAIVPNVRRYVQLAQSRGGACFCTRGAMQG